MEPVAPPEPESLYQILLQVLDFAGNKSHSTHYDKNGHQLIAAADDVHFKDKELAERVLADVAAEYYEVGVKGVKVPPLLWMEGHTSVEHKSHEHSVRISTARAELCAKSVRQHLHGLMPDKAAKAVDNLVRSKGLGAIKPLKGFDDGGGGFDGYVENRRVDVHLRVEVHPPDKQLSDESANIVARRTHRLKSSQQSMARMHFKGAGMSSMAAHMAPPEGSEPDATIAEYEPGVA